MALKLYRNIIASSYDFYASNSKADPYIQSVVVTAVAQIAQVLLLIAIMVRLARVNVTALFPNPYVLLLPLLLWVAAAFIIYPKSRVAAFYETFKTKPLPQRRKWRVISALCILMPVALMLAVSSDI